MGLRAADGVWISTTSLSAVATAHWQPKFNCGGAIATGPYARLSVSVKLGASKSFNLGATVPASMRVFQTACL